MQSLRPLLLVACLGSASCFSLTPSFLPSLRSHSNRATSSMQKFVMSSSKDLIIVGAGTLGTILAKQYRTNIPDARVIAETKTDKRHADLVALGVSPRTKDSEKDFDKVPNVVFCVAPGGNDDYPAEVRRAVDLWGGSPGRFVFTSSAGVFVEENGGIIDENSPKSTSERSAKLLEAEKTVLSAGGTVLYLSGLYSLDRGAHSFWLKSGTCSGRPDGLIGLVSYEDAALAAYCAVTCEADVGGEAFVICDGKEQTRRDIIDSALKTKMWGSYKYPEMAPAGDPMHAPGIGKRYNTKKSALLGWTPKYSSFDEYCEVHKTC